MNTERCPTGDAHESATNADAPELELPGLLLRAHGYRFRDAEDAWDGNWLDVSVLCRANGARVEMRGALLRNDDLSAWARDCEALREGRIERAGLAPLEPALRLTVEPVDTVGHFRLVVELAPEDAGQYHRFIFGLDQTALPAIVARCRAIVARFPRRGDA
jgi:hypothetical protein